MLSSFSLSKRGTPTKSTTSLSERLTNAETSLKTIIFEHEVAAYHLHHAERKWNIMRRHIEDNKNTLQQPAMKMRKKVQMKIRAEEVEHELAMRLFEAEKKAHEEFREASKILEGYERERKGLQGEVEKLRKESGEMKEKK